MTWILYSRAASTGTGNNFLRGVIATHGIYGYLHTVVLCWESGIKALFRISAPDLLSEQVGGPEKVPGLSPGCLDMVRKKCIKTMCKVRQQFPEISIPDTAYLFIVAWLQ